MTLADDIRAAGAPLKQPTDAQKASRVLVWDIETRPAQISGEVYDLKMRSQYLPHRWITEPGAMVAWGAHWLHEPGRVMYSDLHDPDMLTKLWALLDEASYDVTYNGVSFDHKRVRGYFARAGLPPARPSKRIDLIKTVRTLGFESNSLEYACRVLGTEHQKLAEETGGAGNWRGVVDGDPTARKLMRRYCTHDVRATADLYVALLPFVPSHPHMGFAAHDDALRCPRCGSADHRDVGSYQAEVIRYRQHRCGTCRGLFRSVHHSRAGLSRAI